MEILNKVLIGFISVSYAFSLLTTVLSIKANTAKKAERALALLKISEDKVRVLRVLCVLVTLALIPNEYKEIKIILYVVCSVLCVIILERARQENIRKFNVLFEYEEKSFCDHRVIRDSVKRVKDEYFKQKFIYTLCGIGAYFLTVLS